MGEFNSDDHYIYYCRQESLRRNGVAIMVNKRVRNALYPAMISFIDEGEIKSFADKQKLREFSTTKPALQQILKDLL